MRAKSACPARILVVDDEPGIREAIRMMLVYAGHEVASASSAPEALAIMEKRRFDLVLTDFWMPDMKGDEFAAIIKERDPNQPVVMVTAYAEMLPTSGDSGRRNIDRLLPKPFTLEELCQTVAELVVRESPGVVTLAEDI